MRFQYIVWNSYRLPEDCFDNCATRDVPKTISAWICDKQMMSERNRAIKERNAKGGKLKSQFTRSNTLMNAFKVIGWFWNFSNRMLQRTCVRCCYSIFVWVFVLQIVSKYGSCPDCFFRLFYYVFKAFNLCVLILYFVLTGKNLNLFWSLKTKSNLPDSYKKQKNYKVVMTINITEASHDIQKCLK